MRSKVAKFLIVGGFSAIVNVVSRAIFGTFSSYMVSIILAFFVALTTAFCLNKFWVFEPSRYKSFITEYFFFLLVNLLGLLQTIIISYLFNDYIFPYFNFNVYNATFAHAIGVVIPVFTSYFGHKYLSFRMTSKEPNQAAK